MDFAIVIFTAILTLAQITTAYLGYREAARRDKIFAGILTVISVAAAVGIVIEGIVPQFDYARLDLRPEVGMSADGQAIFFFKATNNLQWVAYAQGKTNDPTGPRPFTFLILIRKGEESIPRITLPPEDWTFDIDAAGDYGKILQRIIFKEKNGAPLIEYMQVKRKGIGAIICQTPKRRFIPLCQ